jgi:hypothetical protein
MRPILSIRSCLRGIARRAALDKQPIIFDFREGRAYRETETARSRGLVDTLLDAIRRRRKKRVVTTVEGIPPHVIKQPKT